MIEYLAPWWPLIASGLLNTVLLAAAIAVLSTILAIAVSLGLVSTRRWLAVSCRAYVEIFRSVPALVLLMLMDFGLGEIVGDQLMQGDQPLEAAVYVADRIDALIGRQGRWGGNEVDHSGSKVSEERVSSKCLRNGGLRSTSAGGLSPSAAARPAAHARPPRRSRRVAGAGRAAARAASRPAGSR